MRICTALLSSTSPYSQSKRIDEDLFPKLEKESHDDFDRRLWREKATFVPGTRDVAIPAMALKMSVDEACKRLGLKVPGRGTSTYAKFFIAGQLCEGDVAIGITADTLEPESIWANADGVRGSGKRVRRTFPHIRKWKGVARFLILDEIIPTKIFEKSLVESGRLIGIGRFRPQNGGLYGRFQVDGFEWEEI